MRLSTVGMTRREVVGGVAGIVAAAGLGLGTSGARQLADDPAVAAATQYSRWEVDEQIWLLYREIHPDARAEVPFYAVRYWYENVFLPRGPQVIEPTGVRYVDWTWEVTGKTYASTAEVSFTQAFADGETVEDVVRLVEDDGTWRWFFGRDRTFVDEQIALGGERVFPASPTEAPAWAAALVERDVLALDALPAQYPSDEDATIRTGAGPGGDRGRVYLNPDFASVASVYWRELGPDQVARDVVQAAVDDAARLPSFEVLAWDVTEGAALPYATLRQFVGPVNQDDVVTILASTSTDNVWEISGSNEDAIEIIGELLAGAAI